MSIIQKLQAKSLSKSADKFIKQYDYAGRVLYVTFADTLGLGVEKGDQEDELDKLYLKQAIAELLGNPSALKDEITLQEKKSIIHGIDTIKSYKDAIMSSQPDIREFIVQTARMLFFYDMMVLEDQKAVDEFLKSTEGKALQKVLGKYGGEYQQINPNQYDKICEAVAQKTQTQQFYKEVLKGKAT